jgi:hypothetical protein
MTENKDFDSIEFFRSIRDKHAVLLAEMRPDEIIAFFQTKTGTDNVFPELNKESLTGGLRASERHQGRS